MSAFASLLDEACTRLRAAHRCTVALHFDWNPDAGARAWSCWYVDPQSGKPVMHYGESGEQSLRRLVEAL